MKSIKVNEVEILPFKSDKAAKIALHRLKRERNEFFSSVGEDLDFHI